MQLIKEVAKKYRFKSAMQIKNKSKSKSKSKQDQALATSVTFNNFEENEAINQLNQDFDATDNE